MLNPAMFYEVCQEVGRKQNLVIVDVGAGTGSLSREFLHGDVENDPALSRCARQIQQARKNIVNIINIDNQQHYIDEGQKITDDERISFKLAEASKLPLDDGSADLVISRQVLMHLSPEDLQKHFREIWRVLRAKCAYIFTVTNPGVEHLKYVLSQGGTLNSILEPRQAYQYPHGAVRIPKHIKGNAAVILQNMIGAKKSGTGTSHFLNQYFHVEVSYYEAISRAHLIREKQDNLYSVVPGFEKTHARYYPPALPTSILFKVRKPI